MSCAHAPYNRKQTKHNFVIGKNYQGKNYGFAAGLPKFIMHSPHYVKKWTKNYYIST